MEAVSQASYGPESRFTKAHHRCPNPDLWHSWDDHSAEVEVSEMLAGLVRGLQPEVVIETGAAWGQTTEAIGRALQVNEHGHLYSFEPDPKRHEHTWGKCFKLRAVVTVFPTESITGWIPPGEIDFAFFDSTFPLRVPEFLHYLPHMTDRTIVAFHDTAPQAGGGQLGDWYDLATEIKATLASYLHIIEFPTPRGLILGQVV